MFVKNIIKDMWPSIWPMITFISVVVITLRLFYLFKGSRKFSLYKEILSLVFIVYILCLYYVLIAQDNGIKGGVNLIPFKEMFRYTFGSYKFMKNVVGNIILFIPFGFLSSYFLNNKKASTMFLTSLIISFCAEGIQYYVGRVFDIDDIILNVLGSFLGYLLYIGITAIKNKLPKFMRSDAFINVVVIIVVVLLVLFSLGINIFSYL